MRIPEIRVALSEEAARLHEAASTLAEEARVLINMAMRIENFIDELHRRPAVKRAPRTRASITPELKKKIKAYAAAHPRMHNATIGRRFNVDGGRVSEVLAGKRK